MGDFLRNLFIHWENLIVNILIAITFDLCKNLCKVLQKRPQFNKEASTFLQLLKDQDKFKFVKPKGVNKSRRNKLQLSICNPFTIASLGCLILLLIYISNLN